MKRHATRDRHEMKRGQGVAAGTIPQPHALPLVGNLFDMDAEAPLRGLMELARVRADLRAGCAGAAFDCRVARRPGE